MTFFNVKCLIMSKICKENIRFGVIKSKKKT